MEIRTIGIDLGKTVFHLVGVNARGEVVVRKKCSRIQVLRFTSNLRECLIGMEACGGSHFLGRALREQGHDVRLMPAQHVKPYVKTNKNDYIDAEACAEAVPAPPCALCRSRPTTSSTCSRCTECASGGLCDAPR
jgi:transposase